MNQADLKNKTFMFHQRLVRFSLEICSPNGTSFKYECVKGLLNNHLLNEFCRLSISASSPAMIRSPEMKASF